MIHIDTSDRGEQRKFGIVMAAAISVLGGLRWIFHGFDLAAWPKWFLVVAAVFLVLGLAAPKLLQPVFKVWMKFALVVNVVMTHVVLTAAFFLLIVPMRILVRIFAEDPLKRAMLPPGETYWEEPEEQPADVNRYRNQF